MKIVSIEHLEKGFQYKRMNTIYNNSTLDQRTFQTGTFTCLYTKLF